MIIIIFVMNNKIIVMCLSYHNYLLLRISMCLSFHFEERKSLLTFFQDYAFLKEVSATVTLFLNLI